MIRLSLGGAIASILGKKEHIDYRDVGVKMKIKPFSSLIKVTTPMLYNYMNGRTQTIEAERALVILEQFDILVDDWLNRLELEQDLKNEDLGEQIAREPTREIVESLVELEPLEGEELKRAVRVLIAKHY